MTTIPRAPILHHGTNVATYVVRSRAAPVMACALRAVTLSDAPAITNIYNHYVTSSIVTFELDVVSIEEVERRVGLTLNAGLPWLVAEMGGSVVGYSYASPWKSRAAYRHSVEATVYVAPTFIGQGIGPMLYNALFDRLREHGGIHAVIGGVALPNDASVHLHEKLGMRKVGEFREVGFKFGKWIDVAYWQRIL